MGESTGRDAGERLMRVPKLSIVVPAYNEEGTLVRCVERVLAIATDSLELEILIVDDASTDQTLSRAQEAASRYPQIRVIHHEVNQGKGAALRTGFHHATGEFVLVQDADFEYDPADIPSCFGPILAGKPSGVGIAVHRVTAIGSCISGIPRQPVAHAPVEHVHGPQSV